MQDTYLGLIMPQNLFQGLTSTQDRKNISNHNCVKFGAQTIFIVVHAMLIHKSYTVIKIQFFILF